MICSNCNSSVSDGCVFCPICGSKFELKETPAVTETVEPSPQAAADSTEPVTATTECHTTAPSLTVPPPAVATRPINAIAITGFILSFFSAWIGAPFFPAALTLCIVGLVIGIKYWNGSGKGFAIAGIVISVTLTLLCWISITFFVLLCIMMAEENSANVDGGAQIVAALINCIV